MHMNSFDLGRPHNLDNCFHGAILVEHFMVCWTAVHLVDY